MPEKNEDKDENVVVKPKINILTIAFLFFIGLLCLAMFVSFYMLIKMQNNPPQVEVIPESTKNTESSNKAPTTQANDKSKDASKEVATSEGAKPAKSSKVGDEHAKPQYYKLRPAIVVNIQAADKTRFLQVDVELMTRNASGVDNMEAYAPLIRNDLITLFSTQKYEDIITVEGKEELRKKALEIVQKVMKQNTGDPVIEQVLFTNFVSQ